VSWYINTYWAKDVWGEWRPVYSTDIDKPISLWKRLQLMWEYKGWIKAGIHYGGEYVAHIKETTPFLRKEETE